MSSRDKFSDIFDSISPIDSRYWDPEVAMYLSENAFTNYKLLVELALVKALHKHDMCSEAVVNEIHTACGEVTTAEVYEEEDQIHHDIRALVNCIRRRVSDEAKPFVHFTATSYDVIDTANAARYRDAVLVVLLPVLLNVEQMLIRLTKWHMLTLQIGRTHGQHAVPITVGFAFTSYVSQLGSCIQELRKRAIQLVGKCSGAVGAYNASSLFLRIRNNSSVMY